MEDLNDLTYFCLNCKRTSFLFQNEKTFCLKYINTMKIDFLFKSKFLFIFICTQLVVGGNLFLEIHIFKSKHLSEYSLSYKAVIFHLWNAICRGLRYKKIRISAVLSGWALLARLYLAMRFDWTYYRFKIVKEQNLF